ncbi:MULTISPECIES: C40 family peptidase [Exiguobacterium]|uniref:C40 family peptidase n=1 Tax=Exiguobacterium TaxID=33986 RepID=UPI0009DF17A5|nr:MULTISPECIES: C40 family peptidase [Exiguobacterium]MCK2156080.1 NlpC/P60 family protein [Exiguobacterium sp. 17-1]
MKRFLASVATAALVVSGFASVGTDKVEAASTVTKVKITDSGLRVRTAPSTKASIVGKVNAGQTFTYKGKSGSWTKISYGGKTRYVSTQYTKTYKSSTSTAKKSTTSSSTRTRLLSEAAKHKGTPYVWGGTTTRGFDCSGFTSYVYKKAAGKTLPRTSSSQYSSSRKVSVSNVQPGDLVFFSHGSGIQHVGMATSKSSMVNSETGGVKYSSFKSGYWGSRLVGAGSYL